MTAMTLLFGMYSQRSSRLSSISSTVIRFFSRVSTAICRPQKTFLQSDFGVKQRRLATLTKDVSRWRLADYRRSGYLALWLRKATFLLFTRLAAFDRSLLFFGHQPNKSKKMFSIRSNVIPNASLKVYIQQLCSSLPNFQTFYMNTNSIALCTI